LFLSQSHAFSLSLDPSQSEIPTKTEFYPQSDGFHASSLLGRSKSLAPSPTVELSKRFSHSSSLVSSKPFTNSAEFLNSRTLADSGTFRASSNSAIVGSTTQLVGSSRAPSSSLVSAAFSLSSDPNASGGLKPLSGSLGMIIGAVLGCLVLVIAILLIFHRLRKTKSGDSGVELEMGESDGTEFEMHDSGVEYLNPFATDLGDFADVFTINAFDERNAIINSIYAA
jgi:hypothetical protein